MITENNQWILQHTAKIDAIITQLDAYRLKGSYGGSLNLKEIIWIFVAAKAEIRRLQGEIERLEGELVNAKISNDGQPTQEVRDESPPPIPKTEPEKSGSFNKKRR